MRTRTIGLLLLAALPLSTACEGGGDDPALDERNEVGPEFVGRAPDGSLTPPFTTEAELHQYIEANRDRFPEGTEILRR